MTTQSTPPKFSKETKDELARIINTALSSKCGVHLVTSFDIKDIRWALSWSSKFKLLDISTQEGKIWIRAKDYKQKIEEEKRRERKEEIQKIANDAPATSQQPSATSPQDKPRSELDKELDEILKNV